MLAGGYCVLGDRKLRLVKRDHFFEAVLLKGMKVEQSAAHKLEDLAGSFVNVGFWVGAELEEKAGQGIGVKVDGQFEIGTAGVGEKIFAFDHVSK